MHLFAHHPIHNTLKFHANARYFAEVAYGSEIQALRKDPVFATLPWYIIGGGSNVLIQRDLEGVVIQCNHKKIKVVNEDEDSIWLSVGGGYPWPDLVEYTVDHGWWGLENLAHIPGTVGAAPVQNIGAFGTEVQDVITRVQVLDLFTGLREEYRNKECEFAYRSSIFKTKFAHQKLIQRVTFHLRKRHAGKPQLIYDQVAEMLERVVPRGEEVSPRHVFDAIVAIRQQRLPDPEVTPNAGSFFHNPVISQTQWVHLQQQCPSEEIPHYMQQDGRVKVPAGWLIERAGWRGYRRHGVGVCQNHALVLVHYSDTAKAEDLVALAADIQQSVLEKFSIHLEPEVTYMG